MIDQETQSAVLAALRKELEEKQKELNGVRIEMVEIAATREADPNDRGSQDQAYRGLRQRAESLTRRIHKIHNGLSRWESGRGTNFCDCGNEISIHRLIAQPTTTHCVACKEREEKTGRNAYGIPPGRHMRFA